MDIYISVPSIGFPYHEYPYDFWRFEIEDMKTIFSDFHIEVLTKKVDTYGLFLKAKKPKNWTPIDLSDIALYSILLGKRTNHIVEKIPFSKNLKFKLRDLILRSGRWVLNTVLK